MSLRITQRRSFALVKEIQGTPVSNTSVTVGATSTEIAAANTDRVEIIIVNDSDEEVYLAQGAAAVMNKGIRLNRRGGTYISGIFTGVINGICASGSKNVCVSEL